MSDPAPSPNGRQTASDHPGRDQRGRFVKGCRPGPGNPYAAEVGRRRARLMKSLTDDDVDAAVLVIRYIMLLGAKDSDRLTAARLLLDRALGPIVEADLIARLEALEAAVTVVDK